MNIIPVRVFGGLVAFGTVALRIMSFSFVPAMFTFVNEKNIEKAAQGEDISLSKASRFLRGLAGFGAHQPKGTVLVGALLCVVAIIGVTNIVVNNNMVEWFKKQSEVRIADTQINRALGGTSTGYVVAISEGGGLIKKHEAMRYIESLPRPL